MNIILNLHHTALFTLLFPQFLSLKPAFTKNAVMHLTCLLHFGSLRPVLQSQLSSADQSVCHGPVGLAARCECSCAFVRAHVYMCSVCVCVHACIRVFVYVCLSVWMKRCTQYSQQGLLAVLLIDLHRWISGILFDLLFMYTLQSASHPAMCRNSGMVHSYSGKCWEIEGGVPNWICRGSQHNYSLF